MNFICNLVKNFAIFLNFNPNLRIAFFSDEYEKLSRVFDKSDIMISHYVPLPAILKDEAKSHNNFYVFNGEELLKKTAAKYWIFGHRHQVYDSDEYGIKLLSSPIGYKEQFYC